MSWKQQIQAYDDDALIQLSNAGLLRRAKKQVESDKVVLQADEIDQGVFLVSHQKVTLLNVLLEKSQCDCSASGVCVHILSAVIYTRDIASHQSPQPEESVTHQTLNDELVQLTPENIMKWAGKASTRLAARLLSTASDEHRCYEERSNSLEITLTHELSCRYILGAGLEGTLCNVPDDKRKGVIAACFLYWLQTQGKSFQWPAGILANSNNEPRPLKLDESSLIEAIHTQIKRILDCGLMHLPIEYEDRLRALAWSVRSESLPRLSALLLLFVGEMAAFRKKQAGTDSQQLLDLLTATWVLCERILRSPPQQLQALRGTFRRDYIEKSVGPLWSCSTYQYRTPGGAVGVSTILWDLESRTPLWLNTGRTGEASNTFNPRLQWQTVIPWSKGNSLVNLNGQVLQLVKAKVSEDNRLSQSQETELQSILEPNDFKNEINQLGFTLWKNLMEFIESEVENEDILLLPVIIRPQKLMPFTILEQEQRWISMANDSNKNWLRLSAPIDVLHNNRIAAFNKLIETESKHIWGVVLEAKRNRDSFSFTPTSLILKRDNSWRCFNPDFETLDEKSNNQIRAWLKQVFNQHRKLPANDLGLCNHTPIDQLLLRVRQLLIGASEIGLECRFLQTEQIESIVKILKISGANQLAQAFAALERNPTHEQFVKAYYFFNLAWRKLKVQKGFEYSG